MSCRLFVHLGSVLEDHAGSDDGRLRLRPGVLSCLLRLRRELPAKIWYYGAPSPAHKARLAVLLDLLRSEGLLSGSTARSLRPLLKRAASETSRGDDFVITVNEADLSACSVLPGVTSIWVGNRGRTDADHVAESWEALCSRILLPPRTAEIVRRTTETDVQIRLNLDGGGRFTVETGLGFFDHMLCQIAKHAQCDLEIQVDGDLNVDEHHTIEDTALALGQAFDEALGDRRGIERYGFLLPMDDALAQVALDFSGRSWLLWDAAFSREKVGDVPTEMFSHFFKSFADAARCNLNIRAEGSNEHHKIEAIFKAFGKSLRQAIGRQPGNRQVPSTKGVL